MPSVAPGSIAAFEGIGSGGYGAWLFPALVQSAGGTMVNAIGYDGFFVLSGALSFAAVLFLPALARISPRKDDR